MNIIVRSCVVLALAAAAGCSSSDSSSTADDKYTQTWSKSYSQTTCNEWLNEMTPEQRFAGAADMLTGARNKGDGGTGLPEDDLIDDFARDVDGVCEVGAANLAEAGATTYLGDRSTYRP